MTSANFIPITTTHCAENYTRIFIVEIVCDHGILFSIISNREAQFTSRFWRSFQKGLRTKVKLSTAFHPQIDGQVENKIKTLEGYA